MQMKSTERAILARLMAGLTLSGFKPASGSGTVAHQVANMEGTLACIAGNRSVVTMLTYHRGQRQAQVELKFNVGDGTDLIQDFTLVPGFTEVCEATEEFARGLRQPEEVAA